MTRNSKQRASPSKKAAREARPNQLDKRITWASQDLDTIMKDLQRDCKPYYKIVDLVRELQDISHDVKELTKDNARVNAARKREATKHKNAELNLMTAHAVKIEHLESALRGEQKVNHG